MQASAKTSCWSPPKWENMKTLHVHRGISARMIFFGEVVGDPLCICLIFFSMKATLGNPPTPLWRWRRAYWGANSYTKCSITFVNIAVAISALAGGGKNPASRGVAAHTAGLFRSVRGAKGGVEYEKQSSTGPRREFSLFPPWRLPTLGNFRFSPPWGLPKRGNFHFSPVGASQAKNFHFPPPWGLPKLGNFHFSPRWGLPKLGNFHFSPPWGLPKLGNFHFSLPWRLSKLRNFK